MNEAVDKQFIVWRDRAETAEAQRDALVKALEQIDAVAASKKAGALSRMQQIARKALRDVGAAKINTGEHL